MTLQDLGNLGELIAAIATVATLAYLAVQIRHNTQALGHASERAVHEDAKFLREQLIQNAALYRKGLLEPDNLDEVERFQFRMLLDACFWSWEYIFRSGDEHRSGTHKDHIRGTLAQPGGARYWARAKHGYSRAFVEYIDETNAAGGKGDAAAV